MIVPQVDGPMSVMAKSAYTKDGKRVGEGMSTNRIIENAIINEMRELCDYIVKEVGDGTTTVTELAYEIHAALCKIEGDAKNPVPDFMIINAFKKAVKDITNVILSHKREITIEDIYNIAMTSTNSNEEVSRDIVNIYKKFGFGVNIEIKISPSDVSSIKDYDGITLNEGCSSEFINFISTEEVSSNGGTKTTEDYARCILKNPKIYAFRDPINDFDMARLFRKIIDTNIMIPYSTFMDKMQEVQQCSARGLEAQAKKAQEEANNALKSAVPTVIIAPNIARDTSTQLKEYTSFMYKFSENLALKPPLLIITGLCVEEQQAAEDLWDLCGCKTIMKYISADNRADDAKNGLAATEENVVTFGGSCEQVVSDSLKTCFINPEKMLDKEKSTIDNPVYTQEYLAKIRFFEDKIKQYSDQGDVAMAGNMKRRLATFRGSMVEYLIGAIGTVDREPLKDAVEDAVLNIKSACKDGVGNAACFEGYRAACELSKQYYNTVTNADDREEALYIKMINIIKDAYEAVIVDLYQSAGVTKEKATEQMKQSLVENKPLNIVTQKYDGLILSSIKTDIAILEGISKIITILISTNQALLPTYSFNTYNTNLEAQKIPVSK